MTTNEMVKEFHRTYGVPIADKPGMLDPERSRMRKEILREEFEEYRSAHNRDLVETADALADMVYVIYGTALEYGIPLDDVLAEVHRSNMSKLGADGKPVYREDGKVLKGPSYFPPDIEGVMARRFPLVITQSVE